MRRPIIEKSADEFYTSHSGLALIGLGVNRYTSLNAKINKALPGTIDVFCMDNSGTRKEGANHTHHDYNGYAPIGAYLGAEGWCVNLEFREGSQHSQKGFIPFFRRDQHPFKIINQ